MLNVICSGACLAKKALAKTLSVVRNILITTTQLCLSRSLEEHTKAPGPTPVETTHAEKPRSKINLPQTTNASSTKIEQEQQKHNITKTAVPIVMLGTTFCCYYYIYNTRRRRAGDNPPPTCTAAPPPDIDRPSI